jgi:hypothetical protein
VWVSLFKANTVVSADMDLVLRSTQGISPLPEKGELQAILRNCGYTSVELRRLLPTEPLYGGVATTASGPG